MLLKSFQLAAPLTYYIYNPIYCIGWQGFHEDSLTPLASFHSCLESHGSQFGNQCLKYVSKEEVEVSDHLQGF